MASHALSTIVPAAGLVPAAGTADRRGNADIGFGALFDAIATAIGRPAEQDGSSESQAAGEGRAGIARGDASEVAADATPSDTTSIEDGDATEGREANALVAAFLSSASAPQESTQAFDEATPSAEESPDAAVGERPVGDEATPSSEAASVGGVRPHGKGGPVPRPTVDAEAIGSAANASEFAGRPIESGEDGHAALGADRPHRVSRLVAPAGEIESEHDRVVPSPGEDVSNADAGARPRAAQSGVDASVSPVRAETADSSTGAPPAVAAAGQLNAATPDPGARVETARPVTGSERPSRTPGERGEQTSGATTPRASGVAAPSPVAAAGSTMQSGGEDESIQLSGREKTPATNPSGRRNVEASMLEGEHGPRQGTIAASEPNIDDGNRLQRVVRDASVRAAHHAIRTALQHATSNGQAGTSRDGNPGTQSEGQSAGDLSAVLRAVESQVPRGASATLADVPVPARTAPVLIRHSGGGRGAELASGVVPGMAGLPADVAAVGSTVLGASTATTDGTDLPRQIVKAIRLQWTQGVSEARLRLQPDHLGEVRVSLRVEHGVVRAELQADTAEVRTWIRAHEGELRRTLAEQGLDLDQLSVRDEAAGDDRGTRDDRPRHNRRSSRTAPGSPRFDVLV